MIHAAVLGSPISHSLSPLLHQSAYRILDIEGEYGSFEVKAGELAQFLATEGAALNCLSLTMPLKEEAMSIADSVTPLSIQISSGNTLTKVDSQWNLTSTDVEGFSFALAHDGLNAQGKVLVIGAGATARAVVAACDLQGAQIDVMRRSVAREDSMSKAAAHSTLNFLDWSPLPGINDYDLVVNTTPGNSASFLLSSIEKPKGIFFEVLYNPWPTALLQHWMSLSQPTVDGLDLLIHQAISQIEMFSGLELDRQSLALQLRVVGERALQ